MKDKPEIEVKSCGCEVATYKGGRKVFAPCLPCGLFEVARALSRAGDALAAVATTVQKKRK